MTKTWNIELELPDNSYSVSDVQDYAAYFIKKHKKLPTILPRLVFKTKYEYKLELQKSETVKLLKSTGRSISNNKNGENKSHLDVTKVVLIHGIMVDNHYQHDSKVLSTFQISHMVSY